MQVAPDWQVLLAEKRLLIFDFDGTIADTTPLHAAAFTRVLSPLGLAVDYPRIAGMSTRAAMRKLCMEAGLDWTDATIEELARAKQSAVRAEIAAGLEPLPGVDRFLNEVRGRFRLAMVTSGSRETVLLSMRCLGYEGWFDPLITADDVINGKPDPEGFEKALQATGVDAAAALVFEDSEAGFDAATAAGIECVDARHIASRWG